MKNELEQHEETRKKAIEQCDSLIAWLKIERDKIEAKQKPKPQVPTTIEDVYSKVEPFYATANANQVNAFAQLLTLVACLDSYFGEGDADTVYLVNRRGDICSWHVTWERQVVKFKSREAAEHAAEHFLPLFKRYYGEKQ